MLVEWHLTPEYLLENWTDEQFEAFWQARNQRIVSIDRAIAKASKPNDAGSSSEVTRRVSDQELFQLMGMKPQGSA